MALAAGETLKQNAQKVVDDDGHEIVIVKSGLAGAGMPVDTELPAAAALGDGAANPTAPMIGAALMLRASGNNLYYRGQSSSADGLDPFAVLLAAQGRFTNGLIERVRGPNIFKSFASTAITAGTGATIWTPGAGKKFRLMGWIISSSVAGQLIFGDNAVGTVIARSEALAAAGVSKENNIGNGILSAAANNVLKLDGPTGNVAGMVWGTEE